MQKDQESFAQEYRYKWVALSEALFGVLVMYTVARFFFVAWLSE